MRTKIIDGHAFVAYGPHNLLCVGTEAEVQGVTETQLAYMLFEALAWFRFHKIGSSRGYPVH